MLNNENPVERRYSDFTMLSDYLATSYMDQILPELPKKFSIVSDVRKIFVQPVEDLEIRRKALADYLNFLIKNQTILKDKILNKFLKDKRKFEVILEEHK
jgi:hypothetical protein